MSAASQADVARMSAGERVSPSRDRKPAPAGETISHSSSREERTKGRSREAHGGQDERGARGPAGAEAGADRGAGQNLDQDDQQAEESGQKRRETQAFDPDPDDGVRSPGPDVDRGDDTPGRVAQREEQRLDASLQAGLSDELVAAAAKQVVVAGHVLAEVDVLQLTAGAEPLGQELILGQVAGLELGREGKQAEDRDEARLRAQGLDQVG